MAHMRRALHLGKTAYFTFDIEILDVVNIPFPQGRFLVKWNFKSGLLNPKDAEQQAAHHASKPASAVGADPTYAHHLAPPSMHHSVHSSGSSVVSIDPPSEPGDDMDSEYAADDHARASLPKPPAILNSNDKVGFSPSVKLNRSHTAEFGHTLKASVSIPVKENQLQPCELKLSVRHQYKSGHSDRWETSKLGETFINLSQYAHKEWVPRDEKPAWGRPRDDGSVVDPSSYRKVQRFLLQHGKTNALLRLRIDCTMLGGEKFKESHLKAQEKLNLPNSDSSSSLSPSARSRTDSRRPDSEESEDGTKPARDYKSTDGRSTQEVIDDIWAQARREVAASRKNADAASTISSRAPSSDGIIMPEPRRKSEDDSRSQKPDSPVKKRTSPVGHFSLAVPATFRKRTESTNSRTGSTHSLGYRSRQKAQTS